MALPSKDQQLREALASKGLRYVGTRGDLSSPICFIGEAPGADEDQIGQPFVGASGRELNRMAMDAGINITKDCWYTNPFKTKPPENKLDRLTELGIPHDLFLEQFFEELRQHRPTIIIPCGATPLGILFPETVDKKSHRASISKYRGSIMVSPKLDWPHYVIPCTHPAFILREWSERAVAILCLAKACEEYTFWRREAKLQPLPERRLLTLQGYSDVQDFLRSCDGCRAISVDIEMIRRRFPYTIAVAQNEKLAISFSLHDYERSQLLKIWRLLDSLFRSKKIIGQNWIQFDQNWLEHIGFSPDIHLTDDVLVRQHVLWPEMPKTLAFMTMQYTREKFYKDDGRGWTLKDGPFQLQRYNAMDAAVTYEVWQRQEDEFNERSR